MELCHNAWSYSTTMPSVRVSIQGVIMILWTFRYHLDTSLGRNPSYIALIKILTSIISTKLASEGQLFVVSV